MDANKNLVSVTDWANRVTAYTYDANNRVIGAVKPDGSVTTTVYDNKQRVTSTVEKTASGTVITGFAYTYDSLSRIVEEKNLADNTKMCYTYDSLSRVTNRTIKNECDQILSSEEYTYDAAGNVTDAPDSCFEYDTNNRLLVFNGNYVSYDMDGNMLSNGSLSCTYDSANRLIAAGGHTYTYNAEDVRIRNLRSDADTTYTYNTNCKLSQLLMKTTNGFTTKYVYGHGLIGEEKEGCFKTYHFDFRGSTIAITDEGGNITDTFKYDTYGNLIARTGDSFVIFGYNGRDGVVTDKNGLIYMRARYYSPEMRRFLNADVLHGEISDSTSLNRYSYVNGNPVSYVDPFGLSKERDTTSNESFWELFKNSDGSYSLYDNLRHNPDSIFHEQILSLLLEKWSFDIKEGDLSLGSISLTLFNGGWEFDNWDLSLLDFGTVELGLGYSDRQFGLKAMASIWSPSVTVKLFGKDVTISIEVGSIGANANFGKGAPKKFGISYGFGVNISW